MKNDIFRRNIFLRRDEKFGEKLIKFVTDYNHTDVYYTIYTYANIDIENCDIIAPLYFDFDDNCIESDYLNIRRQVYQTVKYLDRQLYIPQEDIQIYFSGNKGFHLIIAPDILGIKPDKELNIKYKKLVSFIAKECGLTYLDKRIYDRKRLFRLPNTINSKSGLYKIQLTLDQLMNSSYEDIVDLAKTEQPLTVKKYELSEKAAKCYERLFSTISSIKNSKPKKVFDINNIVKRPILPCILSILGTSIPKGQRNNTTVVVASSLLQSGRKLDEVEDIMTQWNENNDPPLSERELDATISSAYSMFVDGKVYGCSAIKDLDLCSNNCKLKGIGN